MKLTDDINKKINDLDCAFRFVYVSPTFKEHPQTGKPVVDDDPKHRKAGVYCHIIDKATKETYAQGFAIGSDENGALLDGLARAVIAEKPLTPAQKFTRSQVLDATANVTAENADLRRQIAEMQAQVAALAAKPARQKPGPKPRKAAETEPESTPV